jgi:hypothetical protein
MPFLQSSGAISINDIKNMFGGPASPALSNYYRGGAYVPSTKSVVVREPTSGQYYDRFNGTFYWVYNVPNNASYVVWNGTQVAVVSGTGSSVTVGGYTYFEGNTREFAGDAYGTTEFFYDIYRTSTANLSINTGIPASGTISLQQFYGAEKP